MAISSFSSHPFISVHLRRYIGRFFREMTGVLLAFISLVMMIILGFYRADDPSLNTAIYPPHALAHHPFGITGSISADMLYQFFGVSAWGIPLALAFWGAGCFKGYVTRLYAGRFFGLMLFIIFFAGLSQQLEVMCRGFFPSLKNTGGIIGSVLITEIKRLFSSASDQSFLMTMFLVISTVLAFFYTIGLSYARMKIKLLDVKDSIDSLQQILTVEPPFHEKAAEDHSISSPLHIVAKKATQKRSEKKIISKNATSSKTMIDPVDMDEEYALPSMDMLQKPDVARRQPEHSPEQLTRNSEELIEVLSDFGVRGDIKMVNPGPVVTLYEMEPAPGTKSSRVIGLADDIARSMSVLSVRVAVVPGRNVLGIEMPNKKRETVLLREVLQTESFQQANYKLPLALGKDIGGQPIVADLARMPHLLVAGTTGSGKSVAVNTMILSLLYRLSPDQCKFIMIDPKMLELSVYEGIPHLLAPVVTEPKKAVVALKWTVKEMENRYRAISKLGMRNIDGYNARLREVKKTGEVLLRKVQTGFDSETGKPVFEDQPLDLKELCHIVVVVDEFADLMLVAGKEIEAAIQRLAQMARAAGIHLIMATQRPSVDVITGTIKANFPTRISFHVTSKIDSRTIIGESGAEQLLGQGDMLYMSQGGRLIRVHGPFVSDQEVEKVVEYLKTQGRPAYDETITEDEEEGFSSAAQVKEEGGDDLYSQAVELVTLERKASTSFIQRHLQIGYNRAARIMERMEKEGIVGSANHVGKREVLVGSR
ncbi:MAG: DNA translocase FtsK [Alphaproteobacteria bacterium]